MRAAMFAAMPALAALLSACGGAGGGRSPEITLSLPSPECDFSVNYTFLEKGIFALEAGEYLEALQFFQRFRATERTPRAAAEAGIAIAYLGTLPDSPIYDQEDAAKRYLEVRDGTSPALKLHREIQLMQVSLESFLDMHAKMNQLRRANAALNRELDKREDALKRLRDLTLGRQTQQPAEPASAEPPPAQPQPSPPSPPAPQPPPQQPASPEPEN